MKKENNNGKEIIRQDLKGLAGANRMLEDAIKMLNEVSKILSNSLDRLSMDIVNYIEKSVRRKK